MPLKELVVTDSDLHGMEPPDPWQRYVDPLSATTSRCAGSRHAGEGGALAPSAAACGERAEPGGEQQQRRGLRDDRGVLVTAAVVVVVVVAHPPEVTPAGMLQLPAAPVELAPHPVVERVGRIEVAPEVVLLAVPLERLQQLRMEVVASAPVPEQYAVETVVILGGARAPQSHGLGGHRCDEHQRGQQQPDRPYPKGTLDAAPGARSPARSVQRRPLPLRAQRGSLEGSGRRRADMSGRLRAPPTPARAQLPGPGRPPW